MLTTVGELLVVKSLKQICCPSNLRVWLLICDSFIRPSCVRYIGELIKTNKQLLNITPWPPYNISFCTYRLRSNVIYYCFLPSQQGLSVSDLWKHIHLMPKLPYILGLLGRLCVPRRIVWSKLSVKIVLL